jgi:translocator protein
MLSLPHPPGMLPPGLIAPAWAVLSVPSGVAAWLAWRQPGNRGALLLWGWHLLACGIWMQGLYSLHLPGPALLAALALLGLVCLTARAFARLRPAAGLLLLPTLAWTCYASYVTAGFWWLNRG